MFVLETVRVQKLFMQCFIVSIIVLDATMWLPTKKCEEARIVPHFYILMSSFKKYGLFWHYLLHQQHFIFLTLIFTSEWSVNGQ